MFVVVNWKLNGRKTTRIVLELEALEPGRPRDVVPKKLATVDYAHIIEEEGRVIESLDRGCMLNKASITGLQIQSSKGTTSVGCGCYNIRTRRKLGVFGGFNGR